MTELVLGVDVSKYQDPLKVPYLYLRNHAFYFGIAKFSMGGGYDGNADAHVNHMRAADMDIGGYHWCDPTQNWERQAEFFLNKIRLHKPDLVMFDIEQWWADWAKWRLYINRQIPSGDVPRLSESQVIDNFVAVAKLVIAESGVPLDRHIAYTGRWFTNIFPGLGPAITSLGISECPAHYRTNYNGVNWVVGKEYEWDEFYDLVPKDQKPLLWSGATEHELWQFTSAPKFHEIRLDCILFNGDIVKYNTWLDKIVGPDPDPDPDLDQIKAAIQQLQANQITMQNTIDDLVEWREKLRGVM